MKHLHTYLFAAALALFLVPFSHADAKVTLSSVSVSSPNVAPSATFTITGTAALTSTNPTSWRALSYYYDNNVAGEVCVNIPPHSAPPDATYIESITARAPATAGAHTVWVSAFYLADCFNIPGTSNPLSKSASITVVAQTPVTVSSVSVAHKVYDGTPSAGTTTSCTLAGSPAGVTCSGTGTFVDKNVGSNKQVSVTGITLSGPNASLYSLAVTTATTSASITKAPLTVTASSASRVYGEANPAFTGTLSGFVASENATSANIAGTASCSTTATAITAVGTVPTACTQGTLAAGNYSFATFIPGTLTVTQASQSISFPLLYAVVYGDTPQTLAAVASSGLPVTYTSLTPVVCTAADGVISVVGVGVCSVRAQQSGDANHVAAPSVEQSFVVSPAATTTTLICPASVVYSGVSQEPCTATVTGPGLSQILDVSYSSNVHVGTVTARAAYEGTSVYNASSGSAVFTITPLPVTLTIADTSKVFGVRDSTFTYTLSRSLYDGDGIAGEVTREAGEDAGVYALQRGTLALSDDYDLVVVPGTLTITSRVQEIVFSQPEGMTFGDIDQALHATSSTGLTVALSSGTPDVCAVVGTSLHIAHAGTCHIIATQAGDRNTQPALAVSHAVTIARAATVAQLSCPVSVVYTGDARAPCTAHVRGPGLEADVSPMYTNNAAVGTATATAAFVGTDDYESSSTTREFSIIVSQQTITFTKPHDMVYGDEDQPLFAESDMGLPVTFRSRTAETCSVVDGKVHVVHAGQCIVVAQQNGSADVAAAEPVEHVVPIAKKELHISPHEQSKLVTTADPLFTSTMTGLVSSDVVVGALGREEGETVGQYAYTRGTLDAGEDYVVTLDTTPRFTITPDTTPPEIESLPDSEAEATSQGGARVEYDRPRVHDDVDTEVEAVCVPASGSTFPIGSTTVTCTARDSAGNSATPTTSTVIVHDTTRPLLTLVGESTLELTTPAVLTEQGATWSDAVDGAGSVAGTGDVDVNRPGIYRRTYTYTDAAGNAALPLIRTIIINDGEAPVFSNVPTSLQQEAVSAAGAPVTFMLPLATDAVDGETEVTCNHASGDTFPLGTTVIQCEATDTAGHTAYASWQVTIADTTPPVVTLVGDAGIAVDVGTIYTDAGATWTDAVDGTGAAEVEGVVDTAHPGTYIVKYSHTDAASNKATPATRTVNVVDRVAPVVTLVGPAKQTLFIGEVYTEQGATWSDAVDGADTVQGSGEIDTARAGTYIRTYTYTDAAGNVSEVLTRTIVVEPRPVVTTSVSSGGGGGVAGTVYTFPNAAQQNTSQQEARPSPVVTLVSPQSALPTESIPTTPSVSSGHPQQSLALSLPALEEPPRVATSLAPTPTNETPITTVDDDGNRAEDATLSTASRGEVLGVSTERVMPSTPEPISQPRVYTQVATTALLYDFFVQNPLLLVLVLASLAISGITGTALYRLFSETYTG